MFGFRGQARPPTWQTIGPIAQSVVGRSRGSLTMMVRQENGTANVGKSTSGFSEDLNEAVNPTEIYNPHVRPRLSKGFAWVLAVRLTCQHLHELLRLEMLLASHVHSFLLGLDFRTRSTQRK